jgi:hypothetical protein
VLREYEEMYPSRGTDKTGQGLEKCQRSGQGSGDWARCDQDLYESDRWVRAVAILLPVGMVTGSMGSIVPVVGWSVTEAIACRTPTPVGL